MTPKQWRLHRLTHICKHHKTWQKSILLVDPNYHKDIVAGFTRYLTYCTSALLRDMRPHPLLKNTRIYFAENTEIEANG